jgi:hypothetical protein
MYLSGKVVDHPKIGVMLSFNASGQRQHGHKFWAVDNGCFSQPEKYDDNRFLHWLDGLDRTNCLFAVAPDVVGDAKATLQRAKPMLPKIHTLGFKVAYAAQDGAKIDGLPWSDFDCLFIGGTNKFKLSQAAGDLIAHALTLGKWVHMGRVNSYKRLRLAHVLGVDSVDGTYLSFGPDKLLPKIESWLDKIELQPRLELTKGETNGTNA